jgi:hypothetical protein
LARVTGHTIQLHRLTQAVLRDHADSDHLQAEHDRAEAILAAAEPDDNGADAASWPDWAALLPHLLAGHPETAGRRLRDTACNALYYLAMRGEYATAAPLARAWHQHWYDTFGADDHHTLWAASQLAIALRGFGDYRAARTLDEDVLARRRRVLGEDHPDTLVSASKLAADLYGLGEYGRARELDEDVLARRRRVLGEDHPNTLTSANNLAVDLAALEESDMAASSDDHAPG